MVKNVLMKLKYMIYKKIDGHNLLLMVLYLQQEMHILWQGILNIYYTLRYKENLYLFGGHSGA